MCGGVPHPSCQDPDLHRQGQPNVSWQMCCPTPSLPGVELKTIITATRGFPSAGRSWTSEACFLRHIRALFCPCPVASSPVWAQPPEERLTAESPMGHSSVSPCFFLSWRCAESSAFRLIMSPSGLSSDVPEHPEAHLNSVHPHGWEHSEPARTWLLSVGCCIYVGSAVSHWDAGPLTGRTVSLQNLPADCGLF